MREENPSSRFYDQVIQWQTSGTISTSFFDRLNFSGCLVISPNATATLTTDSYFTNIGIMIDKEKEWNPSKRE